MPISSALKAIYASAPITARYIDTLAFSHSHFSQTYYLTNDNQPWQFLLETGQLVTFQAIPFRVELPSSDGQGTQDMDLIIANIGRDLVDPIEAAIEKPSEPIKCTYRVYLDTAQSAPQNTPVVLSLTGVQISRDTVSATATRADVLGKAFPANFYTATQYPGLRR